MEFCRAPPAPPKKEENLKKKERVANPRWVCGCCYMTPPCSSRRRNGAPAGLGAAAAVAAAVAPGSQRRRSGHCQLPPGPGAAPMALGESGRRAERRGEQGGRPGFPRAPAGLRQGGGSSGAPPPRFPPHLARPGLRTRPRPASCARAHVPRHGAHGREARGAGLRRRARRPLLSASLPNRRSPASGEGAREPGSHLLAAGEDSRLGLGCPMPCPHLPAGPRAPGERRLQTRADSADPSARKPGRTGSPLCPFLLQPSL